MSAGTLEITGGDYQSFHSLGFEIDRLFRTYENGPAISLPREVVQLLHRVKDLAAKIADSAEATRGLSCRDGHTFLDGTQLYPETLLEMQCPDGTWVAVIYDAGAVQANWHGLPWRVNIDLGDDDVTLRWPTAEKLD